MLLDARHTALVVIDLQQGIVGMDLAPHSGAEIVSRSIPVAHRFRAAGAPVFPVRVSWQPDYAVAPSAVVDSPPGRPPGGLPDTFSTYVEGVVAAGDVAIVKRQWGAFHGTELDLQLRRRAIRTVVIGGIATNFGVESTARSAWEHGYDVVIAKDLCTSVSTALHDSAIEHILPRIACLIDSADLTIEKT